MSVEDGGVGHVRGNCFDNPADASLGPARDRRVVPLSPGLWAKFSTPVVYFPVLRSLAYKRLDRRSVRQNMCPG